MKDIIKYIVHPFKTKKEIAKLQSKIRYLEKRNRNLQKEYDELYERTKYRHKNKIEKIITKIKKMDVTDMASVLEIKNEVRDLEMWI